MRARRIAKILFPETNKYGSGYFLTDRLVLTAGHVAAPYEKGEPCKVYRYKFPDHLGATIAWISAEPDAALIILDQPVEEELPGPTPEFGRAAISEGGETYDCLSIGFPSADVALGVQWSERNVRGTATELFDGTFDVVVRDLKPTEAEGWSGLSGAALFRRDLLFALFKSVPEAWGGTVLKAIPIWPLLGEASFRDALALGGMTDPSIRPMAHSSYFGSIANKIEKLYFLVDRDSQIKAVEAALAAGGKRIFYAEGQTRDCLDLLIERLANEPSVQQVLGDKKTADTIIMLHWPEDRAIDPDDEFERLRGACAKALLFEEGSKPDAKDFASALGPRCIAFWWLFDLKEMGDGHAELLRRWADFCADIQALGAGFYWFACQEEGAEPARPRFSFAPRREPDPTVVEALKDFVERDCVEVLETLPPIRVRTDVAPWIERISAFSSALTHDERQDVKLSLDKQLGASELPLGEFRIKAKEALKALDA